VLAAHGAQRISEAVLPWLARRYAGTRLRLPAAGPALAVLLALTVLDLVRVDGTLIEARPLAEPAPAASWLRSQPGLFRVYSPSYSLPPGDGLQHLDGVDPLQMSAVVAEIERATGIASAGYSVTLPAFATADLAAEHAGAIPSAARLARFDVQYVAAEFDVAAPGLALVQRFGTTRVYQNTAGPTRAWMEPAGTARVTEWTPNRITATAVGPGRLVLSEIAFPGWRVTVDGDPAAIMAAGIFRAVDLAAGEHVVVFTYAPWTVRAGLGMGVLGTVLVLAAVWTLRRERGRW
jgi:hypothetical protein